MQERSMKFKTARVSVVTRSSMALYAAVLFLSTSSIAYAVEVKNAWARETPAGAQVGAGFVTFVNSSHLPDRLVDATVVDADHVEIHEMSIVNGVMQMQRIAGIDIPAKQTVELKSGGNHLMLIGLKHSLKDGETFKGVLKFERAGSVPVEFSVKKSDPTHSPM